MSASDNEKENNEGQREIIYNDNRAKLPRRHDNPKCVCTKQQSCKYMKEKLNRTERRNKHIISMPYLRNMALFCLLLLSSLERYSTVPLRTVS